MGQMSEVKTSRQLAKIPRLLASVCAILVICLSSCVSSRTELFPPKPGETTVNVFVISHGWHTGIIVPREAVDPNAFKEMADFDSFRFVEFGWGERSFYMSERPSFWGGIRAALWRNDSVVHIVGFNQPPAFEFPYSDIYQLKLTQKGFLELIKFITGSVERVGDQKAAQLGPGLYGSGFFYPSNRTFHLFAMCNRWTALSLRAAGTPISTFYALTAGNVLYQVGDFSTKISP